MQTAAISPERIGDAVDHLVTAPISNWTILKGLPLAQAIRTDIAARVAACRASGDCSAAPAAGMAPSCIGLCAPGRLAGPKLYRGPACATSANC